MMRIYITYCSAKKNDSLKTSGEEVTPDKLYTSGPIRRFMNTCKQKKVNWAIFSDGYGVWFPNEKKKWYEKSPNLVTEEEFKNLVNDFNRELSPYDEILFYYNPGRFHGLYQRLLQETKLKDRIRKFTHISEIV